MKVEWTIETATLMPGDSVSLKHCLAHRCSDRPNAAGVCVCSWNTQELICRCGATPPKEIATAWKLLNLDNLLRDQYEQLRQDAQEGEAKEEQ